MAARLVPAPGLVYRPLGVPGMSTPSDRTLDLLGVPCPLNWAKAKNALADMLPGERLELLVDDPRALRDIPRAAEMEGHCILATEIQGPTSKILIEV